MSNQELVDRYVYAVVKHLPRRQAADIEKELHGLVEDMLAERCGERPAELKDVMVVLTELGTPQEMAAQYGDDRDRCLLSQPYYSQYKTVLKWVLFAVTIGIGVSLTVGLLVAALEGELDLVMGIRKVAVNLGELISAWFGVIGALTVVFAIMERRGVRPEELTGNGGNLMELPPVPEKKEKASRADAIAEIFFSIVFLCVFLLVPQAVCGVFTDAGRPVVIPVFNPEVMRQSALLFVGISLCGVVPGVFQLMEGRYTLRLAAVIGVADLLSIIFLLLWVSKENLLNPVLLDRMKGMFTGEDAWIGSLAANALWLFVAFVAGCCVIEFAQALYRALKYRQK